MNVNPLTDPDALRILLGEAPAAEEAAPSAAEEPAVPGGFVGWQAAALAETLASGDNILLAVPTGTGKTFALHQVVQHMDSFLVTIEGKEGRRKQSLRTDTGLHRGDPAAGRWISPLD